MVQNDIGGVYAIRNITTGEQYIGSSVAIKNRKRLHLYHLRRGNHHSPLLQASWNTHGERAFEFVTLELWDVHGVGPGFRNEPLTDREQWYLDTGHGTLNASKDARSKRGVPLTPQARKQKAAQLRKIVDDPQWRAEQSARGKARAATEEGRAWLSELGKRGAKAKRQAV